MAADSVIINSSDGPAEIVGVHGGTGPMFWKRLATGGMLHGDWESFEYCRVPPGSTIGEHVHSRTEEIYYIVAGRGEMSVDDARREVGPGDLIVTPLNGMRSCRRLSRRCSPSAVRPRQGTATDEC